MVTGTLGSCSSEPSISPVAVVVALSTGTIRDFSGAVIVASIVVIRDTAKKVDRFTTTDGNGEYAFYFLLPSRYTLTVAHHGFRTQSREVIVSLGPAVSVNIVLEIASARASTTVTAQAPKLQAGDGDSSTTLNHQQISELPNPGNDLTYIAQSAPPALSWIRTCRVCELFSARDAGHIQPVHHRWHEQQRERDKPQPQRCARTLSWAKPDPGSHGCNRAAPNCMATRSTGMARLSMRTAGSAMYFKHQRNSEDH